MAVGKENGLAGIAPTLLEAREVDLDDEDAARALPGGRCPGEEKARLSRRRAHGVELAQFIVQCGPEIGAKGVVATDKGTETVVIAGRERQPFLVHHEQRVGARGGGHVLEKTAGLEHQGGIVNDAGRARIARKHMRQIAEFLQFAQNGLAVERQAFARPQLPLFHRILLDETRDKHRKPQKPGDRQQKEAPECQQAGPPRGRRLPARSDAGKAVRTACRSVLLRRRAR